MPARHLHIGAGALGLGLTAWATRQVGLDLVILNRSSASDSRNKALSATKQFRIDYPDNASENVTLNDFLFLPDDIEKAKKFVQDPATILLTTALKEYGVREMAGTLGALLHARLQCGEPLYFVACENAITSRQVMDLALIQIPDDQRENVRKAVIPLDCVVDRICNKPNYDGHTVTVVCERFAQWYIEEPVQRGKLSCLTPGHQENPAIRFVPSLEEYVYRKKWVVNALHLSTAIAAYGEGYSLIHRYLENAHARSLFMQLGKELEEIFEYWLDKRPVKRSISVEEMRVFYDSVQSRILTHPQRVADATTRLRKNEVIGFMKDFHRKLVEPFLMHTSQQDKTHYQISRIMARVDEIIAAERFMD